MFKKSQIHTEVFVYILALVIVSFIVVYGYSAARDFQETTHQVNLLTFKTELEGQLSSYVGDLGSRRNKEVRVPQGFDEVCFVDLTMDFEDYENQDDLWEGLANDYPLIFTSWMNQVSGNIFLLRGGVPEFILYVPDMELESERVFICEEILGRNLEYSFRGKGGSVEVTGIN